MCAGHSMLCPDGKSTGALAGRTKCIDNRKRDSSAACPGASRKTKGAGHSARNDGAAKAARGEQVAEHVRGVPLRGQAAIGRLAFPG
jgi:hypothetical protein